MATVSFASRGTKLLNPSQASASSRAAALQHWEDGSLRSVSLRKVPRAQPHASRRAQAADNKGRKPLVVKALVDVDSIDAVKFDSLVRRRVVFGHDEWKKHKSSGRYFRHIKTILTSKVIGALGLPVGVMTGIATAICGWNELAGMGALPEWAPILHISNLPFTLTAPALSFLLVFRTNSSYGRFDEARKMWGLMLNRTRDITRQALSYMARDDHTYEYPKRAQFIRHLQAFPLAYKHHFLQEGSLEEDLRQFTTLSDAEIKGVLGATHRPNYVLQMMSECMRSCTMEPAHRLAMEANFATFADDVGGSERLFKTPIPLSYTRLTSRFLEVGVIIENPFPILALDVIAQSARNNAAELVSLHEGIRELVAGDDLEMKMLSTVSQQALLPSEPAFVAEPEPEYSSDWDEDVAALVSPPNSR
ncbi:unnamed protein product [Closterium sp. Yama58-4]|nr:unnamed protein product [Closterium sp. Yama58-4]